MTDTGCGSADELEARPVELGQRAVRRHLRALLALGGALVLGYALYAFQSLGDPSKGWRLLALALVLAAAGQRGVSYPELPVAAPPLPASHWRRRVGLALACAGVLLWAAGVRRLLANWELGFDVAWSAWLGACVLLGVGCDLMAGTWPRRRPRLWSGWPAAVALSLLIVAAAYRLGNIADFPGEGTITQIEDLQVGAMGDFYLHGSRPRWRWEYLSSTWLAALGLWLGGPSQLAVRVPFAVVSALKLLPLFAWLRLSVGTVGALTGCALMAVSFWDVVLSRIPNNHSAFITAVAFAVLAGPVRRGRPSAYVLLGFIGGYVLHEYVAYRPLVLWALLGATWWSLGDRRARWPLRLTRPLLTLVLTVSMVIPLFMTRIPGEMRREYLDGWYRAKGYTGYYDSAHTWRDTVASRLTRARNTAELFVYRGDQSPVRNLRDLPLIDPVSAGLLILGIAGAAVHWLRPVLALTLAGGVVHVVGALVLTGNFDVARVGGAVVYVYALVGIGAAGACASLASAWGRAGRALAVGVLVAAVGWAAWWNTRNLQEFWSSAQVRRAHHHPLSYLTIWLRDNLHPGERVLGVAPNLTFAVRSHDGIWLLGRRDVGTLTADVDAALRTWAATPGPTLFVLFSGEVTEDLATYLHWLSPQLALSIVRGPYDGRSDIAFTHASAAPTDLADRLAATRCRGAVAEFTLLGDSAQHVLAEQRAVVPLVVRAAWPAAVMDQLEPLRAKYLRLRFAARFRIHTAGEYSFSVAAYPGQAKLHLNGQRVDGHGYRALALDAGLHELIVDADVATFSPNLLLRWLGPDTGGRAELMPFYRIAEPDPACVAAAADADAS